VDRDVHAYRPLETSGREGGSLGSLRPTRGCTRRRFHHDSAYPHTEP
jgi:hypothetical protein